MSDKRAPRRSLDDWMELVTECRQSGLTDAAWCEAQGISPSCFYNAVSRLRKKAARLRGPVGWFSYIFSKLQNIDFNRLLQVGASVVALAL